MEDLFSEKHTLTRGKYLQFIRKYYLKSLHIHIHTYTLSTNKCIHYCDLMYMLYSIIIIYKYMGNCRSIVA